MVSMTSFEILPPPESNSDRQDAQSPDFEVYSNSPSSPGAVGGGGDTNPRSVQSIISSLLDSRAEEMQKKVSDLLQENNILKDKVKKSNIVMLEQLNTISSWGKEIAEYKKKQAELLEEKQKSYGKVAQENEELKAKINELEASLKAASEKPLPEQDLVKEQEMQQKFGEKLQEQSNDLEEVIRHLTQELDELQNKNKLLDEQNKELTAFNACLVAEIEQVKTPVEEKTKPFASIFNDDESGYAIVFKEEEKPCFSPNDSAKIVFREFHELQLKYCKMCAQLEEEKSKAAELEKQLEEKSQQISIMNEKKNKKREKRRNSSSSGSNTAKDWEELAYALYEKTDLADLYHKKSEELEKELEEVKSLLASGATEVDVINELRAEISRLKESLKQEESVNETHRKSLAEAEVNLRHVSEMHERAMKLLDVQEESQMMKSEQLNTMRDISDRHHLEQLDIVTAKLFNMEQLLEAEQERTQQLQSELDKLKDQSEEISVLKAQVLLFQADFDCEKEALKEAKAEIEKLTSDKVMLENELEELKNGHSHRGHKHGLRQRHQNHHRGRRGRNCEETVDSAEDEGKKKEASVHSCPCCKMIFHDVESLESHMELCLNDDIFLA